MSLYPSFGSKSAIDLVPSQGFQTTTSSKPSRSRLNFSFDCSETSTREASVFQAVFRL